MIWVKKAIQIEEYGRGILSHMINFNKIISIPKSSIHANGPWLFSKRIIEITSKKIHLNNQVLPLFVEKKDGVYDLICGYEFFIVSSLQEFKCLLVTNLDDYKKGLLNLFFFSSFFKDIYFYIIPMRYFHDIIGLKQEEIYKIFEPYLEQKSIKLLLKWCKYPSYFDNILINGNVSLDICDNLEKFSEYERKLLVPFFENLRWGKNKAKIFLDGIYILKKRKKEDLDTLIDKFSQYLKKDLSPNDKIQIILEKIRDEVYPTYRYCEKEFFKRSTELTKGNKNIKIIPSKGFELDKIILEVTLDNKYSVKQLANDIIKNKDKWNDFLNWYLSLFNEQIRL